MRDIDWTMSYVNEKQIDDVLLKHVCMLMRDILLIVC